MSRLPTVYSVSQLAEILQRSRSSIRSLIRSGRLSAFDAAPEGRLRQYRVTEDALQKFIAEHSATPPKKPRKRVRKPLRQWV